MQFVNQFGNESVVGLTNIVKAFAVSSFDFEVSYHNRGAW